MNDKPQPEIKDGVPRCFHNKLCCAPESVSCEVGIINGYCWIAKKYTMQNEVCLPLVRLWAKEVPCDQIYR